MKTLRVTFVVLLIAACSTLCLGQKVYQPKLTPQNSGTTELLISVSPVNSQVVWAAGTHGTFVVTTNGGKTWKPGKVKGAEYLQFRGVRAVSANVAYLLSIGNAVSDFRIYKTEDGGTTWTKEFQNRLAGAFYDCFAFWTPKRGIAHSDSVNGVFPDLRTTDGMTWQSISSNMPPALPGEFSFSASDTCVATQGENNAWIATGGPAARILATTDGGNTWNAYDTPIVANSSAGAFSVDFRNPLNGIVAGGDLDPSDPDQARTATSSDGGKTWALTNPPPVTGAIWAVSYVRQRGSVCNQTCQNLLTYVVVTADEGGAAWSPDEGTTWYVLPGVAGGWAVAFAAPEAGWLVGTNGEIIKISF